MLNLNDVYLFVQAVQYGGFAPAARALRMSKSGLSNRIAALEQQLGTRLIQRTSRQFSITDVGEEFFRHARAMLAEAESAELVVQRRLTEPAGPVRITSSSGTLHGGLASVLTELAREFPKIEIVVHASNEVVDLVAGGFDLAIRAHQEPLADSSLIQRRLGFCTRWLVAAPAYLADAGVPQQPSDLEALNGVCMPSMVSADGWLLYGKEGTAQARIQSRVQSDDVPSLTVATLGGLGIGMLPAGACLGPIAQGRLVRILPKWSGGGAHITMLAPHRRGQLLAVRAASGFVAERLPPAMALETH